MVVKKNNSPLLLLENQPYFSPPLTLFFSPLLSCIPYPDWAVACLKGYKTYLKPLRGKRLACITRIS